MFDRKLPINKAETIVKYLIANGVTDAVTELNPEIKKKLDDIAKKIHHECMPTIHLAHHLNISNVEFITAENKRYDALFYFEQSSHLKTIEIECVTAMDQQEDALRIEFMKTGLGVIASMHGEIKVSGTKNKRKFLKIGFSTNYKAEKEKGINIFAKILEAVENKIQIQKNGNYRNTILIIYVDDKRACIHPIKFEPVLNEITESIRSLPHNFKGIYIVGTSGKVIPVVPYSNQRGI